MTPEERAEKITRLSDSYCTDPYYVQWDTLRSLIASEIRAAFLEERIRAVANSVEQRCFHGIPLEKSCYECEPEEGK